MILSRQHYVSGGGGTEKGLPNVLTRRDEYLTFKGEKVNMKIKYIGKNIWWKNKKSENISWNIGYVFEHTGEMIRIGSDDTICGDLYHSNWYELKDIKIKVKT